MRLFYATLFVTTFHVASDSVFHATFTAASAVSSSADILLLPLTVAVAMPLSLLILLMIFLLLLSLLLLLFRWLLVLFLLLVSVSTMLLFLFRSLAYSAAPLAVSLAIISGASLAATSFTIYVSVFTVPAVADFELITEALYAFISVATCAAVSVSASCY